MEEIIMFTNTLINTHSQVLILQLTMWNNNTPFYDILLSMRHPLPHALLSNAKYTTY